MHPAMTDWMEHRPIEDFRFLLDSIQDGYYELTIDGEFVFFNRAMHDMLGCTYEQLIGRNITEFVIEEHVSRVSQVFHEVLMYCSDDKVSWDYVTQAGIRRSFEASISLMHQLDTKSTGFRGIIRDITERRNAEEALRESERQLRALIRQMPDFVNLKDADGRWLIANDFAVDLYQLHHVDFVGKTDAELAEYADFYRDALLDCYASDELTWNSGHTTRVQEKTPLPDGTTKIFDVIKMPLFYPDGSRKALLVMGRDITELVKAEELLVKSEKLSVVGELAAGIAHEIRNPLTAIKGFVQLLAKSEGRGKPQYFEIMSSELHRIEQIVNEFLVLAKPSVQDIRHHSIAQILQDVQSLLDTHAILYNLSIQLELPREGLIVYCDKNRMKQVFVNLIKNAIEASPPGSHVTVCVEEAEDGMVHISITDEGHGISEDTLERLGQPFFTTKESGNGLGLMVTQKILKDHDGSLHIESEIEVGTVVTVCIPKGKDVLGHK